MHNSDFGKQTTRRPKVATVNKFSFRQYSCNPKQDQLQGERISEVERENRILFDRISNILKGKQNKPNLSYVNDQKLPFTNNLRRLKSKVKDHDPFGLPPDKTRDLLAQLAKERYDKLVERDLAAAEISEKLPALTKRMPRSQNARGQSETLDIESQQFRSGKGSLQPSYRQHTINSQDKSFSLERADVNYTFVERRSRVEDNDKYRALNISDMGPERDYHHHHAPTKPVMNKFRTIQTKDNSYYMGKGAYDEPSSSEYTPITPEQYEKPTILHRKTYRLQGQNYLIEISELAGSLSITALNNDKNKTIVKRISKDKSLSVLHEFKYDFDHLCSNLIIQDNNISLASANTDNAPPKVRSNGNQSGREVSFDEPYNGHMLKPLKPKVERIESQKARTPVADGLFDRLSRSRLSPLRVLGTQEPASSEVRSASYNSKVPARTPTEKATANSHPLIIEYSSYGRKMNEGKGSASALPWGESTAPKIKNHFQDPDEPSVFPKSEDSRENPESRNSQPELPWEDNSSHIFGQRAAQENQGPSEDNQNIKVDPEISPKENENNNEEPTQINEKELKDEEEKTNTRESTHNTQPDILKEKKNNIVRSSIASQYLQEEIYEDDFDKDPVSQKIATKNDEISEMEHLNSEEQPNPTKATKTVNNPEVKNDEKDDDEYIVVLDDSDEELNDDKRKENEKEEEMKRSKRVVNPFNLTKEAKTEATPISKEQEDEEFQNNSEPTERHDYDEVRKLLTETSKPNLNTQEERKATDTNNKVSTLASSISMDRMALSQVRDPGDAPSFHPTEKESNPNRLNTTSQVSQRSNTKGSRRYSTRNEPDNEDPESKERIDFLQIDTQKLEPDMELNVNSPIKSRVSLDGNTSKILPSKYSIQKRPQNATEVSIAKDFPISIKYTDP